MPPSKRRRKQNELQKTKTHSEQSWERHTIQERQGKKLDRGQRQRRPTKYMYCKDLRRESSHMKHQRCRARIFKQGQAYFNEEHSKERQQLDNKQKDQINNKSGCKGRVCFCTRFRPFGVQEHIHRHRKYHHLLQSHTRPSNLVFHDLTKGEVMTPSVRELLGLSRKFIPTDLYTATAESLEGVQFELRRNVHLKSVFA